MMVSLVWFLSASVAYTGFQLSCFLLSLQTCSFACMCLFTCLTAVRLAQIINRPYSHQLLLVFFKLSSLWNEDSWFGYILLKIIHDKTWLVFFLIVLFIYFITFYFANTLSFTIYVHHFTFWTMSFVYYIICIESF